MTTRTKPDEEAILNTFLDLVRLDSPSGNEGPVREYLIERFKRLSLPYEVDSAGNLLVRVPANRSARPGACLAITGHMDVVPPCIGVKPIVEGDGSARVVRSSGDTVLGADDKAALAPLLEALELSLKAGLPRPELLLLITVEEEVMLGGARNMSPDSYRDAELVIAIDHTGEQGTLIYEAPTYIQFEMTVHGKSVHAGIMPEKGVNAIQLLSRALDSMPFGRLDANTTCNIGFITGGKATNIVPDKATARGELRGHDEARLKAYLDRMQAGLKETVAAVQEASEAFQWQIDFHHYQTDLELPAVQRVVRAMTALGITPKPVRTNGGSDVNVFAQNGVPGIVLSAGYVAPHALTEHVALKDMTTCAELLLEIWGQFAV